MLNLLLAVVIWIPVHVGWTWLKPLRACHGKCKGSGRLFRRGVARSLFGAGQGHALCPDCGGNGREPKPMHTFLYEYVRLFNHPADETGPGWRRRRARMARQRAAGRRVVR